MIANDDLDDNGNDGNSHSDDNCGNGDDNEMIWKRPNGDLVGGQMIRIIS